MVLSCLVINGVCYSESERKEEAKKRLEKREKEERHINGQHLCVCVIHRDCMCV